MNWKTVPNTPGDYVWREVLDEAGIRLASGQICLNARASDGSFESNPRAVLAALNAAAAHVRAIDQGLLARDLTPRDATALAAREG